MDNTLSDIQTLESYLYATLRQSFEKFEYYQVIQQEVKQKDESSSFQQFMLCYNEEQQFRIRCLYQQMSTDQLGSLYKKIRIMEVITRITKETFSSKISLQFGNLLKNNPSQEEFIIQYKKNLANENPNNCTAEDIFKNPIVQSSLEKIFSTNIPLSSMSTNGKKITQEDKKMSSRQFSLQKDQTNDLDLNNEQMINLDIEFDYLNQEYQVIDKLECLKPFQFKEEQKKTEINSSDNLRKNDQDFIYNKKYYQNQLSQSKNDNHDIIIQNQNDIQQNENELLNYIMKNLSMNQCKLKQFQWIYEKIFKTNKDLLKSTDIIQCEKKLNEFFESFPQLQKSFQQLFLTKSTDFPFLNNKILANVSDRQMNNPQSINENTIIKDIISTLKEEDGQYSELDILEANSKLVDYACDYPAYTLLALKDQKISKIFQLEYPKILKYYNDILYKKKWSNFVQIYKELYHQNYSDNQKVVKNQTLQQINKSFYKFCKDYIEENSIKDFNLKIYYSQCQDQQLEDQLQFYSNFLCFQTSSPISFDLLRQTIFLPKNEEQKRIEDWVYNHQPFSYLFPFYFGCIFRSDSWEIFCNLIIKALSKQEMLVSKFINYFTKKLLYQLIVNQSEVFLHIKIQEEFGTYNFLPLIYWDCSSQPKQIFNELIYYKVEKCKIGIFSLGIGKATQTCGKSMITNHIFDTKFQTNDLSPFSFGTVDIDFDRNWYPTRNLCIADAHGIFNLEQYALLFNLFSIIIVHFQYEDIKQQEVILELEKIVNISQQRGLYIILFLRDMEESINQSEQKSVLTQDSLIIQSKLYNNYPEKTTFILQDLENKSEIQKLSILNQIKDSILLIIRKIYIQKREFDLTKRTFARLIHSLNQNSNITDVYNLVCQVYHMIEPYRSNFFDQKFLPMRYFSKKLKEHQNQILGSGNQIQINQLIQQKDEIENNMKKVEESLIINKYHEIFEHPQWIQIIIEISKMYKEICKLSSYQFSLKKNQILYLEKQPTNVNDHIKKIEMEQEQLSISNEVIWREMSLLLKYGRLSFSCDFIKKLHQLIQYGENIELIDGDNLELCIDTIEELGQLENYKNSNIYVISVIGAQSSGKSTLLNYLFGCKFLTSANRCTKGIYASLLPLQKQKYGYNYLLILDTEGLLDPCKNDVNSFDRKITLFTLNCSNLVLFLVRSQLEPTVKNLLQVCIYNFATIKMNKQKKLDFYIIFNQINLQTYSQESELLYQITYMKDEILKSEPSKFEVIDASNNILKISSNRYKFPGTAFQPYQYHSTLEQGAWGLLKGSKPVAKFTDKILEIVEDIFSIISSNKKSNPTDENLLSFFRLANSTWATMNSFSSIIEIEKIQDIIQNDKLQNIFNKFVDDNIKGQKLSIQIKEAIDYGFKQLQQKSEHRTEESVLDAIKIAQTQIQQNYFSKYQQEWINQFLNLISIDNFPNYLINQYQQALQTNIAQILSLAECQIFNQFQQKRLDINNQQGYKIIGEAIKTLEWKKIDIQKNEPDVKKEFDNIWKAYIQEQYSNLKEIINLMLRFTRVQMIHFRIVLKI